MKKEDLASYNKKWHNVSRLGTDKVLQMVVSIKTQVSINPRQHKLIWVCIDKGDCKGLSMETLKTDPWVCHSEDIDGLIMDEKNLHIWYTLIELSEQMRWDP